MLALWLGLVLAQGGAAAPSSSVPAATPASPVVRELVLTGNHRTRRATFEGLLPRPLPAPLEPSEVAELERRIRNLGIFDAVAVARRGSALEVEVREKWTLVPSFALSTGQEAIDTSVTVGLTESNLFGTGHALTVVAGLADRGPFAELELDQHDYAPGVWSHAAELGYESAELRLGDQDPQIWQRHRVGGGYFALPGGDYQAPLRFGAGPFLVHEWLRVKRLPAAAPAVADGETPAGSSWLGFGVALWVDEMSFDDLAPSGASALLELTPSFRLQRQGAGPGRRGEVMLQLQAARGFRGHHGLIANVVVEAVTAGDPNHSLLLGSQGGVRGLPDGVHWNRAQAFANLEARAAWRFARRWAVQAVTFSDLAAFQPFDDGGAVLPAQTAWSTGVGLRLVPTWLDTLLLRLDAARIWHPQTAWFLQLGTAQYF